MGNYGQSLGNLFGGNFPSAQVGVQISLPLHNRTAEAQLAVAEADGRKLKVLRDQIGSAIKADVRNALQAVTMFLVLQRQSDLIAARSREVRAKADLGEAKANLDHATANTIETHGIKPAF